MEIKKFPKEYWPEGLREIPQPPKELFILGDFPEEDLIFLAVVGSRKFTTYGKDVCEKLIMGLSGQPVAIISGFALGIDTIAHETAMKAKLRTIVFPGSGLGRRAIFPQANVALVPKILEHGGCLISEFPEEMKAAQWTFPMRNRLMAGIARAILVIEAEEKSGTLITARLATEYNRDVLAVPGSIYSPNSKGTNRLIRQGATPITSVEDLLDALDLKKDDEEIQQKLFADLSKEEMNVIDTLREPMARDELIRTLGMSTQEANTLLTVMEIKKLIKEELGEIRRT
ncbi:MAG: DNA-processing protein DprA [Candidatus Paceibacteria bacterium]